MKKAKWILIVSFLFLIRKVNPDFRYLFIVLDVGLVAGFMFFVFYKARGISPQERQGYILSRLEKRIPRRALKILLAEYRLLSELSHHPWRSSNVEVHSASSFTFMEGSSYPILVLGLGLVLLIETPLVHIVMIPSLVAEKYHILAHVVLFFTNIYSVIWIYADCLVLKRSFHELSQDALKIRFGTRAAFDVSYNLIDEVSMGMNPVDANLKNRKTFKLGVLSESNVSILLKKPLDIEGTFKNYKSIWILSFCLDEAPRFIEMIQKKIEAEPCNITTS